MVRSAGYWRVLVGLLALGGALATLSGCASAPAGGYHMSSGQPLASADRQRLIDAARQAIGTPYRYGGNSPSGFDCSGLVQFAHRQIGFDVPRTTASQWRYAYSPDRRPLLPGDLLFFTMGSRKSRHVGIYEGRGHFIHAPSSGKRVSRASLDNPFWQDRLIGSKTFL